MADSPFFSPCSPFSSPFSHYRKATTRSAGRRKDVVACWGGGGEGQAWEAEGEGKEGRDKFSSEASGTKVRQGTVRLRHILSS